MIVSLGCGVFRFSMNFVGVVWGSGVQGRGPPPVAASVVARPETPRIVNAASSDKTRQIGVSPGCLLFPTSINLEAF
jgi:hypothetical protein